MIRFARKRSSIRTGIVHDQAGEPQRRTEMQAPLVGQVLWTSGDWSVTSVGLADDRGFVICAEDLVGLTDAGLLAWPLVQASFVPDWSSFWAAYLVALKLHHQFPAGPPHRDILARSEAAALKPAPKRA